MGKVIQLLLLLSCITTLTYSLPLPSDDSNESNSNSSSSEESKEHPNVPHVLIGNSQPVPTYPNTPNRSRRNTVHTNGHQGGPDESPDGRVIQHPQAPNNGNQNRQVRDTDGQQTPSKIFDSNPTSSSSTEQPDRYSALNRNTQTTGTDQSRYNRQVSDFGQQTPRKVLSSNPNSPSSTEQTDTNLKQQSTNSGGYQSRQVRGTDDLQVPRLLLSTPSTTSTETPTNKDTTPENTETRNDKNDNAERDSEGSNPNVSSTQIPGDVYSENLRKTDENREKRDTNNQDNVPRVFASNANDQTPQTPGDQKVPVNVQNFEHKDRNVRETTSEKNKSTEVPDQVKIVKLDGSTPYGRFQQ